MQKRANTATFVTAERREHRSVHQQWVDKQNTRARYRIPSIQNVQNGDVYRWLGDEWLLRLAEWGWQRAGVGSDVKDMRILPEVVKCSKIVVIDVHFSDYTKNRWSGHFKWVNCMVYKLHLNKLLKKKKKKGKGKEKTTQQARNRDPQKSLLPDLSPLGTRSSGRITVLTGRTGHCT